MTVGVVISVFAVVGIGVLTFIGARAQTAGPAAEAAPSYPGAVGPTADGSPPAQWFVIKAVAGSKQFLDPSAPEYSSTTADVWFRTAEAASSASFRYWKTAV